MLQPTIQNMLWHEGYDAGFKDAKKSALLSLLDELEILETPENDVACDYAEHINKEQITQIINKR